MKERTSAAPADRPGWKQYPPVCEYEIAFVLHIEFQQFFPKMNLIAGNFKLKIGIGHPPLIDLELAFVDPLADITTARQAAILQVFLQFYFFHF